MTSSGYAGNLLTRSRSWSLSVCKLVQRF